MIEPKEVEISGKRFVLSKFPAVQGREIVAKYPLSAMPKLGDYAVNEEVMLKLMSYVGVPRDTGEALRLTTTALVNNHCGDWETLARVEIAMMEYNVSFFGNGNASTFLEGIVQKAQALLSKTLMDLKAQSSPRAGPPSTS